MRIPRLTIAVVAAATVGLVAGCSPAVVPFGGGATGKHAAPVAVPAPVITANVAEGGTIEPGTPVSLTLDTGRLTSVVLRDETTGVQVADLQGATPAPAPAPSPDATSSDSSASDDSSASGEVAMTQVSQPLPMKKSAAASRTWSSPPTLIPGHTMRIVAEATATAGPSSTLSRSFTVAPPKTTLTAKVRPTASDVVGVGYPVMVTFNEPVKDRAAVERALVVETSKPVGPASWSWVDDDEVHFRPKDFWPANTSITVRLNLAGVQASPSVWGMEDEEVRFATGRSQILTVNGKTHQSTLTRNGKVIRNMPISLGGPGYTTRSGIKVIMTVERSHRMRSETVGITGSEAYDLVVPYAMRMTYSGEFLHGAPWNGNIGRANVSHGCTNLRLSDARWMYSNAMIGDPVVTTGTKRQAEQHSNGLGADWNIPWSEWVAGSAL